MGDKERKSISRRSPIAALSLPFAGRRSPFADRCSVSAVRQPRGSATYILSLLIRTGLGKKVNDLASMF